MKRYGIHTLLTRYHSIKWVKKGNVAVTLPISKIQTWFLVIIRHRRFLFGVFPHPLSSVGFPTFVSCTFHVRKTIYYIWLPQKAQSFSVSFDSSSSIYLPNGRKASPIVFSLTSFSSHYGYLYSLLSQTETLKWLYLVYAEESSKTSIFSPDLFLELQNKNVNPLLGANASISTSVGLQ